MAIQVNREGRGIRSSRRGSVAVLTGLMLFAVIGMAALGSEVGYVLYKQRQMQSVADSAAFSAAVALAAGASDITTEARAVAAQSGYIHAVSQVAVTVNRPPVTGPNAGNTSAVEVIVSQPQSLSMVSLFRSGIFNVGARSVAVIGSSGLYCMLALHPTASGAIRVYNNAILTNPNCGVADNSNSATALILSNNASIKGPVTVVGNWSLSNGATLTGSPNKKNAAASPDPYAAVQLQTIPSCTAQSGSGGNGVTINLTPGHFCSGWSYANNVTINLAPGAYYIDQKLNMSNNAVLNGTGGVTLVINGNYAISINNNSTINWPDGFFVPAG